MTTLTIPTADSPMAERVAFGAREMDRIEPDWYKAIHVALLDMSKVNRCIVGQIFGDYDGFCEDQEWNEHATHVRGLDLFPNGFSLTGDYEELTRLWKAEISTRLAADKENA